MLLRYKLSAISVLICSTYFSSAMAQSKVETHKLLATQQAQLTEIRSDLSPIGSIVHSILSEKAFQAINSSKWVLIKGQTLNESDKLCKALKADDKSCKLPDLAGKFLRTVGGKAAPLGSFQGDATDANGLQASTVRTGNSSLSGRVPARLSNNGALLNPYQIVFRYSDRQGDIATTIGLQGGVAVGGSWSTSMTSKDTETRPENYSVNTFIKIN